MSEVAAPRLSVLIPCFNEAHRIGQTIPTVTGYLAEIGYPCELLLVDDGSRDGTWSILERAQGTRRGVTVRALRLAANAGKGRALATGVAAARGEIILFFDADLSYSLEHVAEAVEAIDRGADVVIGARDLAGPERQGYSPLRRLASTALNTLVNVALDLRVADTQCGFKAFSARVAKPLFAALTIGRFGFDIELLFLARRWRLKLERIPVVMSHRSGSSVHVVPDSLRILGDIVRIRRQASRYPARPEHLEGDGA